MRISSYLIVYSYNQGLSLIESLRSAEGSSSVEVHYQNKYYALAAAAALIQYLQYTEGQFYTFL